jgi:hypothetical protein
MGDPTSSEVYDADFSDERNKSRGNGRIHSIAAFAEHFFANGDCLRATSGDHTMHWSTPPGRLRKQEAGRFLLVTRPPMIVA